MDTETTLTGCGCLLIVAFLVGMFGLSLYEAKATQTDVVDTVVRSERVNYKDSSKYLVFGQHEVYEDTDSFWNGKYNSSDLYGAIQAGHTYRFRVTGWRIPFLSWYRNIITYQEIQ